VIEFLMGLGIGAACAVGCVLLLWQVIQRLTEHSRRWQRDAVTLHTALVPFAQETAFTLTPDGKACTVDRFALAAAKAAIDVTASRLSQES